MMASSRSCAASPRHRCSKSMHVIDDVRNFLFGPPGSGGMDLPALNIQRSRDMGLPSYNQARLDFGLPAAANLRRHYLRRCHSNRAD